MPKLDGRDQGTLHMLILETLTRETRQPEPQATVIVRILAVTREEL
jgi:hypothetical protein